MNIVIIGDGKVGFTLTEQLAKENHNIVVIDNNPDVVKNVSDMMDVMGIHGNGASRDVQIEAGVPYADLMIAATSADEMNILSCIVAKKLGAKNTIARIRTPEYNDQLIWLKDELGLSMSINPEFAAAKEISKILRFPSAIKIDSFARGLVDIVEVKLGDNSTLADMSLADIRKKFKKNVLVCAVERNEKVVIPNGDFILHKGDKISITGKPTEVSTFFKKCGILQQKVRSVMIIGGGRITYYLAKQLLKTGMQVIIVEIKRERCEVLNQLLPGAVIIHGDGTEQELLREEGIHDVDAFVALTGIDEENMIMALYAQEHGVRKVVVKINRRSFHNIMKKTGIESIISPKVITTDKIVRYVRAMQNSVGDKMETLYRIVGGKAEAIEFYVHEESDLTGVKLKNLTLKKNLIIACIVRDGKIFTPSGDNTIECGDNVIVVTTNQKMYALQEILD